MATINLGRIKPVWQGAWDSSTQYVAEDIVQYNNHAWVATTTSTNSAPADGNSNWELMARGLSDNSVTANEIADGAVTASKLSETYLTPTGDGSSLTGISSVEIFSTSVDNPGSTATGAYVTGTLTFTPTKTCNLSCGWHFSYRHTSTTHAYWEPRLLDASGNLLESGPTYGGNFANGNSSWNQGTGSHVMFGTQLTAGTTYQFRLFAQTLGATVNQTGDTGHDLHLTAFCMPV